MRGPRICIADHLVELFSLSVSFSTVNFLWQPYDSGLSIRGIPIRIYQHQDVPSLFLGVPMDDREAFPTLCDLAMRELYALLCAGAPLVRVHSTLYRPLEHLYDDFVFKEA